MKKLVIASNNEHKLQEINSILGEKIELLSLKDINCFADIPEDADTLEGNASIKSHYVYDNFHLDCFADDTGLEVEALNGAPGVHTARYATEGHDTDANVRKLLSELDGVENRRARFRTIISLIENGVEHQFEGIVNGTITTCKKGDKGFGYDPIFIPEGYNETFAELGVEVKNKVSHRSRAVAKLCEYLLNK